MRAVKTNPLLNVSPQLEAGRHVEGSSDQVTFASVVFLWTRSLPLLGSVLLFAI